MARILLASFVGAIVLFAWGAAYWMFIAEKSGAFRPLPNEPVVIETLKTALNSPASPASAAPTSPASPSAAVPSSPNLKATGVYFFPSMPPEMSDPAAKKAADEQWTRRLEAGPVGMVIYRAEGSPPMPPSMMVRGFVINFASALLVTLIINGFATGGMGFVRRWAIAIMMGLFAALSTDALRGNWMPFPEPWTRLLMIDTVVGWVLAGAVIAVLCKGPAGK